MPFASRSPSHSARATAVLKARDFCQRFQYKILHCQTVPPTIPDFSPIPAKLLHFIVALGVLYGPVRKRDCFSFLFEFVEENIPDLTPLYVIEVRVVDDHMNSRHEAIIKRTHSIRGKEEDALVVFKCTKEYGYESVPLQILADP